MVFVQVKELRELEEGDIVRGKTSKDRYLVTGNYGGRVTAVKIADITNPVEWEVLRAGEPATESKNLKLF